MEKKSVWNILSLISIGLGMLCLVLSIKAWKAGKKTSYMDSVLLNIVLIADSVSGLIKRNSIKNSAEL